MREKEEKLQFDISDRGFNVKAWYLKDIPESKGDALIEIRKGDILLREFVYPGYKNMEYSSSLWGYSNKWIK